MNARLQQRLERLEAAVLDRTRQAEADADRVERLQILSCLANDPEAMARYNRFLESLSGTCAHRQMGLCTTCWTYRQGSKEVQAALTAFRTRIHVLSQTPNPNKGESQ